MPLKRGYSQETISENIREMRRRRVPQDVAVARALESARRSGGGARGVIGPNPNRAHPLLTQSPRTENVESEGWIKAGHEGFDFYVTEFKHPHFFSVAATIEISPSTTTYNLKQRGFTDWRSRGLYGIGHISPEGLITVGSPATGGRLFPRDTKETYLDLVARALGFEEPHFVGKPSIAAEHVSRRESERIQRGEVKLETRAEREARTGSIYVVISDGTSRRFHEHRPAIDWAEAQIKGKPGMRAAIYREGVSSDWMEKPITGLEANEYGHVHYAPVHSPEWERPSLNRAAPYGGVGEATRYSGQTRAKVSYDDATNQYKVVLSVWDPPRGYKHIKTMYVGRPLAATDAADSAKAFDDAARAGIDFAELEDSVLWFDDPGGVYVSSKEPKRT